MTRANGATWRSRWCCLAQRSALFTLLLLGLCLVVICCVEVSAQSRGQRSVNQATPETHYRPRESHAKSHDDDEGDEEDNEDDWDFMSDAAILSLAAQQKTAVFDVTCAQSLPPAYMNDDYCDCEDGSDEPLTSACSHILQQDPLTFQCQSGGQKFAPVFVGDGVCDCCDGSDEAVSSSCSNTCADRHDQILQDLRQRLEVMHTGLQIRDSYLSQHDVKLESLRSSLEEMLSIASAVQRAFQFKQQTLQDAGTQPSPQEMHQLESMYYQLQGWQYQIFVQRKVLETATFDDKDWKVPFAALVGQCFDYVVNEKELKGGTVNVIPREYVFSFCPFQNITQSEPSYPEWTIAERKAKKGSDARSEEMPDAPQPILLGIWDQWTPVAGGKVDDVSHRMQHYDFGQKCANEQHRVVNVDISCAAENRVVSIEEHEICIYSLVFRSPAACDERDRVLLDREIERVQRVFESSKESKGVEFSSHEEL